MKTFTITLFLFIFSYSYLFAQKESRFEQALKKTIEALNTASTVDELKQVVNQLERISTAEPAEWLPTYYLGFAYLNLAIQNMAIPGSGKEIDRYLKMAQQELDKLSQLQENNSEVIALQGYKHMIYMIQDQAARVQEYSPKTVSTLQKALAVDPDNPRALLLLGRMQYGSAQFFGTSVVEPCELIQQSLVLLKNQEESLHPTWGRELATEYAKTCEKAQAMKE